MQRQETDVIISFEELRDLLQRIFCRHGADEETAAILSHNCASIERDGTTSHGIFRMKGYVSTLKSGWVDGAAKAVVSDCGASFIRVDAANGFAQTALMRARPMLIHKVRTSGCCVLAIRNSHHLSALWPDVEPFADEGLVALSFVAGLAVVVAPGGNQPIFGTNPFAFAAPVAGAPPLVFDFATSALSHGDTRLAACAGKRVPDQSGVDAQGAPTNDPEAILNGGALLPFGGHKGAAIILMVEILSAALTGGAFSREVDFSNHPGAETPKTGQLFLVIDPERGGEGTFAARVRQLVDWLRASGKEVRLAGDRRYRNRIKAKSNGIVLSQTAYQELQTLLLAET